MRPSFTFVLKTLDDVGEQKKIFNEWLSKHKGLLFKVTRSYATIKDDRDELSRKSQSSWAVAFGPVNVAIGIFSDIRISYFCCGR